MQDAFTHAIPTDGHFPSQLIVGSISEWVYDFAGCLLERTLPWQREHGPDLSKQKKNVQKRGSQCRLYIQVWGFKKLEIWNQTYAWDLFVSLISFAFYGFSAPWLIAYFVSQVSFALEVFAYTDFSVVTLGPWYVIISISNRFWGCKCSYGRWQVEHLVLWE